MSERSPQRQFLVDAVDYLKVTAQVDEREIREAFIGLWPSREDFGQSLLNDNDAATKRLSALPQWLRPYVRLDGAAFVRDLEREGVYRVAEISRGVCVFDGPAIRSWQEMVVERQQEEHNGAGKQESPYAEQGHGASQSPAPRAT